MIIHDDDPAFRRWIAQQPCILTGRIGQNHPHHVKLKSRGGKDPDNVVPVFYPLHTKCHSDGEDVIEFFFARGVDPYNEAQRLSDEYRNRTEGQGCPF